MAHPRVDDLSAVNLQALQNMADQLRLDSLEMIHRRGAGHPGGSLSAAEIVTCLFFHSLEIDPANPGWEDRDRFILSKGHAAIGLYPILADVGFFPREWIDTYTRFGSPLGDHPDMNKIPGIDFTSGSLGHGLSVGVGMALGGRLDGLNYRVFVLLGDGELDEGQVWAAAMSAAHYGLGNLVAIVDRNAVSVDGETEEVMSLEPLAEKWRAFGWRVIELDGHDLEVLLDTFAGLPAPDSDTPTVIIAHTVAGKGVSFMEDRFEWHLGYLAPEDEERAMEELTSHE